MCFFSTVVRVSLQSVCVQHSTCQHATCPGYCSDGSCRSLNLPPPPPQILQEACYIVHTAERGISLEQLQRLVRFVSVMADRWFETYGAHAGSRLRLSTFNLYHANHWIIKPATQGYHEQNGCSLVEVMSLDPRAQKPRWFVSHAWIDPRSMLRFWFDFFVFWQKRLAYGVRKSAVNMSYMLVALRHGKSRTHTSTYARTRTRTHARVHAHAYTRTDTHTHTHTQTPTHPPTTHPRMHARTHARGNARTHTRTPARTHPRTHARTHARTQKLLPFFSAGSG